METNKKNIIGMRKNHGATSFMGVTKLQALTHLKIKWYGFKYSIQLGTWLEWIIKIITLNTGERIAMWIAKTIFNSNDCHCCQRKEWLNKLTNPQYDGDCDTIKIN